MDPSTFYIQMEPYISEVRWLLNIFKKNFGPKKLVSSSGILNGIRQLHDNWGIMLTLLTSKIVTLQKPNVSF